MKNKKIQQYSNFFFLKIFLIFVILSVSLSLLIKFITLVKERNFRNDYFNFVIINKDLYVVNINRDENMVSVMTVKKDKNHILSDKLDELSVELRIPLNAAIFYKNDQGFNSIKDFFTFHTIYSLMINTSTYKIIGMNKVDILKIYLSGAFVPQDNIQEKTYGSVLGSYDIDYSKIDEEIFDYFKDKNIINEEISIQVINCSGIDGLGGKVSNMLKNVGFNVVSVISDNEVTKSKIVTLTTESYAIHSLSSIFNMPVEYTRDIKVADISIIIGKDFVSN